MGTAWVPKFDNDGRGYTVWCSRACALVDSRNLGKHQIEKQRFRLNVLNDRALSTCALRRLQCDACKRNIWALSIERLTA